MNKNDFSAFRDTCDDVSLNVSVDNFDIPMSTGKHR